MNLVESPQVLDKTQQILDIKEKINKLEQPENLNRTQMIADLKAEIQDKDTKLLQKDAELAQMKESPSPPQSPARLNSPARSHLSSYSFTPSPNFFQSTNTGDSSNTPAKYLYISVDYGYLLQLDLSTLSFPHPKRQINTDSMLAIATTSDKTHLIFEDRERGYIKLNSLQDETYGIPKMSFRKGDVGIHKCVVAILPLKNNKEFFICSYATSSILKFNLEQKIATDFVSQPEFKKVDKMVMTEDERWLVFSTETKWLFKMDARSLEIGFRMRFEDSNITGLVGTLDSRYVFCGHANGDLRQMDLESDRVRVYERFHETEIYCLTVSPDNFWLYTGDN